MNADGGQCQGSIDRQSSMEVLPSGAGIVVLIVNFSPSCAVDDAFSIYVRLAVSPLRNPDPQPPEFPLTNESLDDSCVQSETPGQRDSVGVRLMVKGKWQRGLSRDPARGVRLVGCNRPRVQ